MKLSSATQLLLVLRPHPGRFQLVHAISFKAGVLAGDVAKEASDLGIPLVGIGYMYPLGYFRQHVNAQGRQEEVYERIRAFEFK